MSKTKITAIIIGLICVFVGLIMVCISLATTDFDFFEMNKINYVVKTHNIDEKFSHIDIDTIETRVEFVLSDDGETCKVEVTDSENIVTSVKIEDDTLKIKRRDNRKWYENIGIFINKDPRIIVYLPKTSYTELKIESISGNVNLSEVFEFTSVNIKSVSGDISISLAVGAGVTLKTTSGDIFASGMVGGEVDIRSTSGDIDCSYASPSKVYLKTTSGDIDLNKVNVSGHTELESVSGDIGILNSDAASFKIKTVSGNVEAEINSSKKFVTDTVSGNILVPDSDENAGLCDIQTTSGDVIVIIVD